MYNCDLRVLLWYYFCGDNKGKESPSLTSDSTICWETEEHGLSPFSPYWTSLVLLKCNVLTKNFESL